MSISALFIKRPVMTSLIMLAVMLLGITAYEKLPVNDLPNVDYPTIQVRSELPGANPDTMASAVAIPLERQFSTIAGIDSMSSSNGQGLSIITLKFNLDRSIDAAAQDVQAAIAKASRQLPATMPTPPTLQKVNPADQPVFYLAVSSPTLPLSQVNEYAETLIAQRISMVSGVALVNVNGSQKYAVRIQVDPKALASRKIGINEVATALNDANPNVPTGFLHGSHKSVTVQASGQLYTADQYKPVVVAYRNGSPVRVQDIGTAIDSVENDKIAAWYNRDGKSTRAIVLSIQRQPGTNTIEVVDNIKSLIPGFRSQIPGTVDVEVLYDRSDSIRESVLDVKFTLLLTIALVIMVIFLFLRNVSATIIPALALPLSIVGTFAAMYAMGFSINNITLMALTLSVGFVVDDAIVMLENIVRHMELGETPMQAAFKGSREIGFTIISMTISLVAVFIPVLFMPGMLGRILNEFAITISMAILISGMVSLTLTPMLCSRFLKPAQEQKHGRLYMVMERFFDRTLLLYERTLRQVLNWRRSVIVITFIMAVFTIWMFRVIPTGLLSSEDTGGIFATTEGDQGVSFQEMALNQQKLAAIVLEHPDVEAFMSSAGASGSRVGNNTGFLFIRLKPLHKRKMNADQIIQDLRPKLAQVPGILCFLRNPPPIRLDTTQSKGLYQFGLLSPNTKELYKSAMELELKMRDLPMLQDVTSDLQIKNPEIRLDIDRDRASSMGITAQQLEDALYYAYGNRQVSTIYATVNQYRVIMEVQPEYQMDPGALSLLYIRSNSGQLVPLSVLGKLTPSLGPLTVNHIGQTNSVTISFNIKPGAPLGDAVAAVEKLAAGTLPVNITTAFQGTAEAFKESTKGLALLLILAIVVIYIVLGILYESYIHPLTILSGLPSAGMGALMTLMIFGKELNLYAFVGIIMLIGIVKKNAIMMIDFALEAQRTENKTPLDAIFEGCIIRFRPIMMTTMAALMGTLPIAMGIGAGADARRPLGLAVVGGLLVSQLLTLYITPVVYYYMDRIQACVMNRLRRPAGEKAAGM